VDQFYLFLRCNDQILDQVSLSRLRYETMFQSQILYHNYNNTTLVEIHAFYLQGCVQLIDYSDTTGSYFFRKEFTTVYGCTVRNDTSLCESVCGLSRSWFETRLVRLACRRSNASWSSAGERYGFIIHCLPRLRGHLI